MLTHILQDRTGPLGEQGGTAAPRPCDLERLQQLVQKQAGSPKSLFFFFSLCKSSKGNAVTARRAAGAKHGSDAMLSNIKQRVVRSRHSAVQLEVILKRPPKRLGTGKSTVTHQAAPHCPPRPPASAAWRANSTIKAVKCHHVISQKLLLSRLGPFDLGLCTYCGVYSGLWLENYKMICIYSRFSAYLSGYLDKLCVLYTN